MAETNPEALLISAVLRTNDHIKPFAAGITTDWFHTYGREWGYISRFVAKYRRTPELAKFRGHFPEFKIYKATDVESYIDDVRESHTRASLIENVNETIAQLKKGMTPAEIARQAASGLLTLEAQISQEASEADVIDDWEGIFQEAERRHQRVQETGTAGIPTGFNKLDDLTGGISPRDYWVIAARPNEGKTWMLIRMACAAIFADKVVQFNSLEQAKFQIAARAGAFIANYMGEEIFKAQDLVQGRNFDLIEYKRFVRKAREKLNGQFIVNDLPKGRLTPSMVAAQIERNKPDVVFIDYLALMIPGRDYNRVAELSSELRQVARGYEVPIVVANQINRAGGAKAGMPSIEDLAGSDEIGANADKLITNRVFTDHVVRSELAKHRDGPKGWWWNHFDVDSGVFAEITGNEAASIMDDDRYTDD